MDRLSPNQKEYNKMRLWKKALSVIVAAAAALSATFFVPPETVIGICTVASAADTKENWKPLWGYQEKGINFSVDKNESYWNSSYSLRFVISDYNYVSATKDITLKKDTYYRFTAMVKWSGYSLDPSAKYESGAVIGDLHGSALSSCIDVMSKTWTKLTYDFYTGSNTEHSLCLLAGMPDARVKGTVWFSDIRLEEAAERSNQWNILCLVFKNVDADAVTEEKSFHYKKSMTDDEVEKAVNKLKLLKTALPDLSDNRVGVNYMDIYTVETPITVYNSISDSDPLTFFDYGDPMINMLRTKHLAEKPYNQVIIVAPLSGVADGWAGITWSSQLINLCYLTEVGILYDITSPKSAYDLGMMDVIHELLHTLEFDSMLLNKDKTPGLHATIAEYEARDKVDNEIYLDDRCYRDYMTGKMSGGRGLQKEVYYRPTGRYVLVSDDMTPGDGFEVSGTLPKNLGNVITVSKIADQYYSGKAIKPTVTVKGAKEGTDYTITYANNTAPGIAKAIIKGKGKYTGSVEKVFNIKLKKPTAKINKSTLKWGKVPGANGYEIYYSKDGGKYAKLTDVTGTSYDLSQLNSGSYKFRIRAVAKTEGSTVYSDQSKIIKFTKPASSKENTPTKAEIKAFKKAVVEYVLEGDILSWDPLPRASGYEVFGAIGEEPYKLNADTKKTSIDHKSLDCVKELYSNKTDTVRLTVRAYMIINGKKVYSEFNPEIIVIHIKSYT